MGGSTYTYHRNETITYALAAAACASRGARLAQLRSPAAFGAVAAAFPHADGLVDLTDTAAEGAFLWGGSVPNTLATAWHAGEPNDYGTGEDCAALRDGKLNDVPCDAAYVGYFCEQGAEERVDVYAMSDALIVNDKRYVRVHTPKVGEGGRRVCVQRTWGDRV